MINKTRIEQVSKEGIFTGYVLNSLCGMSDDITITFIIFCENVYDFLFLTYWPIFFEKVLKNNYVSKKNMVLSIVWNSFWCEEKILSDPWATADLIKEQCYVCLDYFYSKSHTFRYTCTLIYIDFLLPCCIWFSKLNICDKILLSFEGFT